MQISVYYVDGTNGTRPVSEWADMRSDGVDYVVINNGGSLKVHSASLYWLYPEDDAWVIGWGSVRYDPNPLVEILCYVDGQQVRRAIAYMPDLDHRNVKLGWWWPGKPRPE